MFAAKSPRIQRSWMQCAPATPSPAASARSNSAARSRSDRIRNGRSAGCGARVVNFLAMCLLVSAHARRSAQTQTQFQEQARHGPEGSWIVPSKDLSRAVFILLLSALPNATTLAATPTELLVQFEAAAANEDEKAVQELWKQLTPEFDHLSTVDQARFLVVQGLIQEDILRDIK